MLAPGFDTLTRQIRELRLLLAHAEEGLLLLDARSGKPVGERSPVLREWLGELNPDIAFWGQLASFDPHAAMLFELGWNMFVQDVLPVELCLDQLPKRCTIGRRTLELRYQIATLNLFPEKEESLAQVLLVMRDISGLVQKEQAEAEGRMLLSLCEKIIQNRTAFMEFFEEANELVRLCGEKGIPTGERRRHIHTLKGICGIYGLDRIARLCHEIEDRMQDSGADLSLEDQSQLIGAWRHLSSKLLKLFGRMDASRVEIDDTEYTALLSALNGGAPREQLVQMVQDWKLQPLSVKLGHFAEQVRDLARRLGKTSVRVHVETNNLRIAPEIWSGFFGAFTHVVRNAVDHGLETPEERQSSGKPPQATVLLRANTNGEHVVIEIADDGRGIAWERVAKKAKEKGLPCSTRAELVAALFTDGVSTAQEVSEYSGRGVGMSAVRSECQKLGGQIGLSSETGKGTSIRFRFPVHKLHGERVERSAATVTPRESNKEQVRKEERPS